ncbi:MAG TPA: FHA domain-containing protein [Gemmatimonadales bacterium]|nr:FHA domain-containing protein [Gemmatimonadales bacterium]
MAFIEFGGQRYPVPAGEMLVGSGAECHLRLQGPGVPQRPVVLAMGADESVTIRRSDETGVVEINGVRLGAMPQPLLHGDKITIGAEELLFADERKSGSTKYISAVKLQDLQPPSAKPSAPGKPTGTTGGRVVCLTDGREYQIETAALRFGREAGSDVVVPGHQVSRRHAEIVATPRGYMLIDTSTNGVMVNGERVQNQRLLARADVIKIGDEEFRFYADVAPAAPAAPAPPMPPAAQKPAFEQTLPAAGAPAAPAPPARPAAPPPPAPPPAAPAHLQSTGYFESPPKPAAPPPPQAPVPPPAAAAPAPPPVAPAPPPQAAPPAARGSAAAAPQLAKFLVRSGAMKGQRLLVKVPIVNIGRADYCDIVIPDDSVSSQHAKLTRREGIWVLTDLGSTNGTLVDGEKVEGDVPLAPGAFVRFGDVQLVFEPTDDAADMSAPKATRTISAVKLQDLKKPSGPPR